MKLKKLIFAAASAMLLAGCSNVNEPTVVPQEEEYVRAFIKKVGVFDVDHNWCAAQSGAITIMPENEVKELKVYGYTDGEYYLVADYSNVTKPETIRFDMPTGTESVMVVADGVSYTAPINGYIDLSKAQGTAMPSRAGNVNDEGYTWIIAVEDLGGAYDFDFNDAVIGLNVLHHPGYSKVSFTALAAGGTLPLYINFNLGEYYKLYTDKISSISGSRLYPDGTSADKAEFHNWFADGYSSSTMINTGKGVEVERSQCKTSTIYLQGITYEHWNGSPFRVTDYLRVVDGKLAGLSLEVDTASGLKTVANNPTKEVLDEGDVVFAGPLHSHNADMTLVFEGIEVLKNMTENSEFEVNVSILEKDKGYAKIEISHGDNKQGFWNAEEEDGEVISSKNLINKTDVGTLTVTYKPSVTALKHFKEGNMYVKPQGITLNYIKIVDPTKISNLTPVKEQDYLTAPQMFIIPDLGNGGKWQWPTETTCIVKAYPAFEYWCKTPNATTNLWHTNSPVEGTTISR